MIEHFSDFPADIKTEFIDTFCGKLIGHGYSRQVYEYKLDSSLVIKIETCINVSKYFQNVIEYDTWINIKDTDLSKWFAPCVYISYNGNVLIQKKTNPVKKYPDMIPIFLTDTKKQNYGMYKGKFVCHDYGTNNLIKYGFTKRMKKADWWE